jgi:hypothetical protein
VSDRENAELKASATDGEKARLGVNESDAVHVNECENPELESSATDREKPELGEK